MLMEMEKWSGVLPEQSAPLTQGKSISKPRIWPAGRGLENLAFSPEKPTPRLLRGFFSAPSITPGWGWELYDGALQAGGSEAQSLTLKNCWHPDRVSGGTNHLTQRSVC